MAHSNNGTALLVMNLISNIVSRLDNTKPNLDRVSRAISAARQHHIPVVHVTIAFRPGYPEVPRDNPFWAQIASTDAFVKTDGHKNPGLEFVREAAPVGDEIVINRPRISAFYNSDLEVVLRTLGVRNMVAAGVAASGVVLSTVREAMDRDFDVTVVQDLCMDGDEEVHRVLTTKVFNKIGGKVVTADEWIANL
ncbi:Peroxyureidoacrylate/ureidoacrylate amidohydrolase RutB [Colletotrichum orbiculare MAFF 240422]|uniref:Peroxyureidoacrylate/ureidoacrylate amidohydrolase RutB n=1 Tax=Colletotrichum orbiculare (strain 104-T / ATCC 96160 / CBS 514.97 / LARS 414 / MAFF 240422) TaxID=1213857 RepID=N4UNS2_COLOR|nr:Peroxyureidoacrylate/ureidoacrylate amidohydrolase RutB [Colletotrichum orbiculare MAFF 240422]